MKDFSNSAVKDTSIINQCKSIFVPHEEGLNTYLTELALGMSKCGWEVEFKSPLSEVLNGSTLWIHWPEQLTNYQSPNASDISKIKEWLKNVSKKSVIIWTVHNLYRHGFPDDIGFNSVYKLVANYSHIHIHHGNFSVKQVKQQYPKAKPIITRVINHGGYWNLIRHLSKDEARKKLNIGLNGRVVLVFGAIRTSEEYLLVTRVARLSGIKLIIAGRLPYIRIRHRLSIFINKLLSKNKILIEEGIIPEERIDVLLKACDTVFIPRIDSLNSGNVFLGFTFAREVIGPDIGNMGEVLKVTGNPVYDPKNISTLKEAFDSNNNRDFVQQGKINSDWLEENCKWEQYASHVIDAINIVKKDSSEEEKCHHQ